MSTSKKTTWGGGKVVESFENWFHFLAKVKLFHHDCWSVGGTMCESSLFQYLETEISGNCQWICLVLEKRRG